MSDIYSRHIRIKSDNTTAIAYINNKGGVKSIECHEIAKNIWEWAIHRNIHLSAEHIPGSKNVLADKASRVFNENTEWTLDLIGFSKIEEKFMNFDIDLFASRLNCKVPVYSSWKPDPHASIIDSFSASWTNFKFYAFPPFSMIMRTIRKIKRDVGTGVLICPVWPTQAWFPMLMHMLISPPLILPSNVLSLPFKSNISHKQGRTLRLMACHSRATSVTSKGELCV